MRQALLERSAFVTNAATTLTLRLEAVRRRDSERNAG